MLKLFISKSGNYELNEQEITVLAVLNGIQCSKHEYLFTSIEEIAYTMTGRWIDARNKDRQLHKNIRMGIQSLADKGIIKIINKSGENYVFSNDGLEVDTEKEKFIVVELWELQKIFSESNKPFNVFTFFVGLVGTINNKTKEWHMSQDEIATNCRCSKRTVNSYLEQLEAMHLIYVYRHKKRRADGTYHKLNNSYGRYADKDSVIKAAQEYANTVECEDILTKIDRRAIKLRYNAFCNGAKKYQDNPDAVIVLCNECKLYNKSLEVKPVEGSCDGEWKQGEPLELSVFPDDVVNSVPKVSEGTGDWGEPDSMEHDFSVEEILDMPTDSDLQSEGGKPKMDCEKRSQISSNPSNSVPIYANETVSQDSSKRNDLELIDIESLFIDDTDDRPVL